MAKDIVIIGSQGINETPETELLQGMLTAQDRNGQITWSQVTQTMAVGTMNEDDTRGASCRIVVLDTENSSALDAVRASMWATGFSDNEPEDY